MHNRQTNIINNFNGSKLKKIMMVGWHYAIHFHVYTFNTRSHETETQNEIDLDANTAFVCVCVCMQNAQNEQNEANELRIQLAAVRSIDISEASAY